MPVPRVLFVSHDASRSGAPIMLLHFLRWLAADGRLRFAVLLRKRGPLAAEFEAVGPTFVFDAAWPSAGLPRLYAGTLRAAYGIRRRRLVNWARRHGVRLIYCNTMANADFCPVLELLGVPVVTHVHELEYAISVMASAAEFLRLKSLTTAFIAASQAVAGNLTRGHGVAPERVAVHHEFIPTGQPSPDQPGERERVRAELGVREGECLVVGAGSADWRKGADVFVNLASRAAAGRDRLRFVWVGGSAAGVAQLRYDAARLGLDASLRCTGEVADPGRYFRAGDVFALTSREDPYPLVMLEAAAAGLPVLCFADAGGGPEFVEGDAGRVVPYLDAGAMAEAIVGLARDPSERARLGGRAAEKVRARHDVGVAAPKLADELLRLLSATSAT